MNASRPTKAAYFNYIGSIELPLDVISLCHHKGDCFEDINRCIELPEVKAELSEIDPEKLRKELQGYGALDAALADHNENLKRILWIACGEILDNV